MRYFETSISMIMQSATVKFHIIQIMNGYECDGTGIFMR